MGRVIAINISAQRGTEKTSINSVRVLENRGLEGDAHAGAWDRQVSILPLEALALVPPDKLTEVLKGGYTENFTISGIPLQDLSIGKIIKIGEAEVKISSIGKEEFKEAGRPYIVSREGRFGRVIKGGTVKNGDEITCLN
ncbi:MAG: MOSC domain-containing protein [Peptococcaceae bacterium]